MASITGNQTANAERSESSADKARAILSLVFVLLMAKMLIVMVYEYRFYFPANFDESSFLVGRRPTFRGLYRSAFYIHIATGPVAISLATFLMFSGVRSRYLAAHRLIGKIVIGIVLIALLPTGLVIATQAFTGPIAGWGFASLSLATAGAAIMSVVYARKRKFMLHRTWSTRCYLLLCSPLVLRLMSGAVIVAGVESDFTYRLSAWTSWLVPLAIYECWPAQMGRRWGGKQELV